METNFYAVYKFLRKLYPDFATTQLLRVKKGKELKHIEQPSL